MSQPTTTCSGAWADLPALGTAANASFWVALEQDGPWGKKAFTQSRLDPEIGESLQRQVLDAGGRPLLVRRPSDHADRPLSTHRVWIAGGPAVAPWLATAELTSAEELLENLQLHPGGIAALATDEAPPSWTVPCEPILLVCTNGKRDLCCAVSGGPLARDLEHRHPGRVWEATHLGGHRFATTTLSLPSRQMLARVDEELAERALSSLPVPAGAHHDRGLTHLPPEVRAADVWLRAEIDEQDPSQLAWEIVGKQVLARHVDGRAWTVRVEQTVDAEAALPSSCGVAPVPLKLWRVDEV